MHADGGGRLMTFKVTRYLRPVARCDALAHAGDQRRRRPDAHGGRDDGGGERAGRRRRGRRQGKIHRVDPKFMS